MTTQEEEMKLKIIRRNNFVKRWKEFIPPMEAAAAQFVQKRLINPTKKGSFKTIETLLKASGIDSINESMSTKDWWKEHMSTDTLQGMIEKVDEDHPITITLSFDDSNDLNRINKWLKNVLKEEQTETNEGGKKVLGVRPRSSANKIDHYSQWVKVDETNNKITITLRSPQEVATFFYLLDYRVGYLAASMLFLAMMKTATAESTAPTQTMLQTDGGRTSDISAEIANLSVIGLDGTEIGEITEDGKLRIGDNEYELKKVVHTVKAKSQQGGKDTSTTGKGLVSLNTQFTFYSATIDDEEKVFVKTTIKEGRTTKNQLVEIGKHVGYYKKDGQQYLVVISPTEESAKIQTADGKVDVTYHKIYLIPFKDENDEAIFGEPQATDYAVVIGEDENKNTIYTLVKITADGLQVVSKTDNDGKLQPVNLNLADITQTNESLIPVEIGYDFKSNILVDKTVNWEPDKFINIFGDDNGPTIKFWRGKAPIIVDAGGNHLKGPEDDKSWLPVAGLFLEPTAGGSSITRVRFYGGHWSKSEGRDGGKINKIRITETGDDITTWQQQPAWMDMNNIHLTVKAANGFAGWIFRYKGNIKNTNVGAVIFAGQPDSENYAHLIVRFYDSKKRRFGRYAVDLSKEFGYYIDPQSGAIGYKDKDGKFKEMKNYRIRIEVVYVKNKFLGFDWLARDKYEARIILEPVLKPTTSIISPNLSDETGFFYNKDSSDTPTLWFKPNKDKPPIAITSYIDGANVSVWEYKNGQYKSVNIKVVENGTGSSGGNLSGGDTPDNHDEVFDNIAQSFNVDKNNVYFVYAKTIDDSDANTSHDWILLVDKQTGKVVASGIWQNFGQHGDILRQTTGGGGIQSVDPGA